MTALRTRGRTAPRLGRPKGKFVQHRRLDRLRAALDEHAQGITLADLAAALHVTERSVRRYLVELARVVDVESVALVPGGAHVWRVKASERGRSVVLRRTQALGLLAMRAHFEVFRGSALYDDLDVAYRQMRQVVLRPGRAARSGEISATSQMEGRFASLPMATSGAAMNPDDFDILFESLAERRCIVVARSSIVGTAAPESKRMQLAPYALVHAPGGLYLIAAHGSERVVDVFRAHELGQLEATSKTFALPDEFEIAHFDQGIFGLGAPSRSLQVVVEFDARSPDSLRQRKAHPAQKTVVARDGRFRVSFAAADLGAVVSWVLACGGYARALEPPELVQRVVAALRDASNRYA